MLPTASHLSHGNIAFIRPDDIIYKAYIGDQNADSIRKLWKKTEQLVGQLRAQKKPVLILVDLSKLGKVSLSARQTEIAFIQSLDFDKAAVFGDGFLNRNVAKIIVTVSGRGFKINFFSTETEAHNWLLSAS